MGAPLYTWRISKYDPALRDSQGHHLAEDWTFFAQIDRFFNGKQLTYGEYVSVENAYIRSVLRFLKDAGLNSLRISELSVPNHALSSDGKFQDIQLQPELTQNKSLVGLDQLEDVIKLNLREVIWVIIYLTHKGGSGPFFASVTPGNKA